MLMQIRVTASALISVILYLTILSAGSTGCSIPLRDGNGPWGDRYFVKNKEGLRAEVVHNALSHVVILELRSESVGPEGVKIIMVSGADELYDSLTERLKLQAGLSRQEFRRYPLKGPDEQVEVEAGELLLELNSVTISHKVAIVEVTAFSAVGSCGRELSFVRSGRGWRLVGCRTLLVS